MVKKLLLPLFAIVAVSTSARAELQCNGTKAAPAKGDELARRAAQSGLQFLSKSAAQWTAQHNCFGCHVQAVTLEALTVGKHNHYDVGDRDVDGMVKALLLGVTAGGHRTGTAFEGAAWARYDQWIDGKQTGQLLRYGRELISLQQPDGSVPDDDVRKPVVAGTMQTTFQAMQTWRQAYARTADDAWLAPMRRAEKYLADQSAHWTAKDAAYLQDVNYALLGLTAAGASGGEAGSLRLQRLLIERQNRDGGFSLDGSQSDAIATGQTLYALKLAGRSDDDAVVRRGMAWLERHQREDGAWQEQSAQGGADKGATMWGVLGLVTVDAISVVARGVADGSRVQPVMPIRVEARDNQGRGVSKVALYVDDRLVAEKCGAGLRYRWNTKHLSSGKHLVDAVATGADGRQSRARYQLYAGDTWLTEVGARFDEEQQKTEITLRDLAGSSDGARVQVEIFQNDDHGPKLRTLSQASAPGAMRFVWDGNDDAGKLQPRGRYFARISFRDARERALQVEGTSFFHDSAAVQREKFGEVEGQLGMRGEGAANTVVELLDDKGQIVQTTRTTEQGNYRFKNIDKGKYTVRAKKDGFRSLSAPVTALPGQGAKRLDVMSFQ